jgi:hypothetical protein
LAAYRTITNPARSSAACLAAHAAAATGAALGVASTVDAAVVIVNLATVENAASSFSINLFAAGLGAGTYYVFNTAVNSTRFKAAAFAGNQPDNQQRVGSTLRGTNWLVNNTNSIWNVGVETFDMPASGETKYLGFRLTVGEGDTRFGWIEYVNDGTSTTVSRWAYESDLNTGIMTPTASAVPGGAGLAALAFGAAGLRGRRRSHN